MALNFQNIDLFIQGLDQGTEEKLSQGFSRLDNGVWTKQGAITKRSGYELLASGTLELISSSAPTVSQFSSSSLYRTGTLIDRITGFGVRSQPAASDELVAFGSSSIWSLETQTNRWIEKSKAKRTKITLQDFPQSQEAKTSLSSAIINNIRVTAWASSARRPTDTGDNTAVNIHVTVQDVVSGRMIISKQQLADPDMDSRPLVGHVAVVPVDATFFIIFSDNTTAGADVYYRTINVLTPWNISQPVRYIRPTDAASSINTKTFEATNWKSQEFGNVLLTVAPTVDRRLYVDVRDVDGTQLTSSYFLETETVSHILGLVTTNNPYVLFVSNAPSSDNNIMQLFIESDCSSGTLSNTNDLWQDVSGNLAYKGVGASSPAFIDSSPGVVTWFYEMTGRLSGSLFGTSSIQAGDGEEIEDVRTFSYIKSFVASGTSLTIPTTAFQHAEIAGYPLNASIASGSSYELKQFLPVVHFSRVQSVGILADFSGSSWGVWDRDRAIASNVSMPRPMDTVVLTNNRLELPYLRKSNIEATEGRTVYRAEGGIVRFDFDGPEPSSVNTSNLLIHGGGQPRIYDGVKDVEMGFNYFPYLRSWPTSSVGHDAYSTFSTSSGNITSGIRQYMGTYHWYDAEGCEHRSNPGIAATLTTTGSHSANIRIPSLTFTDKDNVRIKLWRTENLGNVFYLITSGTSGDIVNNTTSSYATFVDNMTDTTLISNEILYSIGELPNDPPPNASIFAEAKGRVWCVDDNDGLTLWYTKPNTFQLAPEWSALQTIALESAGGRITALASIDDKLIIFKRSSIYYIYGNGPDATGNGEGFSEPALITSEYGCVNTKSAGIYSSYGILFNSSKGLCIIDRSLNVQFIGQQIENEIDASEVVDISTDKEEHAVRVTLRNGNILCLNTKNRQWSKHSFSGSLNISANAATTWENKHVVAGTVGSSVLTVGTLSGSFTDGPLPAGVTGSSYPMTIQTPWIKTAGIQGFQRVASVSFLGNFHTDHQVRLDVDVDYNNRPSLSYVVTGSASSFVNATSGTLYQFEHMIRAGRQKCESIRFTLSDAAPTGSAQSFSLSGITLRVGLKPGGSPELRRLR